ncbi:hypothetical protein chiPu_0030511, partial [Chiloscyllium punctatum]|nr:hypothetical protein [Chiloscyllium punctatum]
MTIDQRPAGRAVCDGKKNDRRACTFSRVCARESTMRLWGAIPALAVVAGAVAISPAANAENLVEKIVDEFKHEVSDELRELRDRGHEGVHQYKHIVVIYQEN